MEKAKDPASAATKRTAIVALAFLLAPSLFAPPQQTGNIQAEKTNEMWNGRHWHGLAPVQKLGFVMGYVDGTKAVLSLVNDCPRAKTVTFYSRDLLYGEAMDFLDDFYKDPLNRPITISLALVIASRKAEGATPDELDGLLSKIRASGGGLKQQY